MILSIINGICWMIAKLDGPVLFKAVFKAIGMISFMFPIIFFLRYYEII